MKKLFAAVLCFLSIANVNAQDVKHRVLLTDTVVEAGVNNSYIVIKLTENVREKESELTFNYQFLRKGKDGVYRFMTKAVLDSFIIVKRSTLKAPYLKLTSEECEDGSIVNLTSIFVSVIKKRDLERNLERKNLLNLCTIRLHQEIDMNRQSLKKYGLKNG